MNGINMRECERRAHGILTSSCTNLALMAGTIAYEEDRDEL